MRRNDYTAETLNAFVDGELSAADSALFLRHLAGNPELAARVSELTRLKSAVAESLSDLPCRAPDLDAIYRAHPKPRHFSGGHFWRRFGKRIAAAPAKALLAGGAVVAAVLVAAVLVGGLKWDGPSGGGMLAEAVRLHEAWLTQPVATGEQGQRQLAAFRVQDNGIYIPDLGASKLRIAKVSRFGENGVHIGYVGTHACHLSLFIRPATRLGALALTESNIGNARIFSWRENRLNYALLAVGMDPTRLSLIAQDVFLATRAMQPFDRKTQMALRLNRQKSQPCAA